MKKLSATPPMTAMLAAAEGSTRFHMPGHKGLLNPHDMTELARTDDLYAPSSGIAEAERLAALSCGAAHTLMLTGGSTAGLMTMILSSVSPGEMLILPRNVHHAVLSACIWGDIDAVFTDNVFTAIAQYPQAKAVLVTRPDYYGICLDIQSLITIAHQHNTMVLVDEAHGAHYPWWNMPQSAGVFGADAWVQSAHKTLPAMTGCAWLHLSGSLDPARARRFLRMLQTSSPPFPMLESLDRARAWMDEHGMEALASLKEMLAACRSAINALDGYSIPHSDDPTRLVIGTRGRGYSGLEAQALLSKQNVDVEMADDACIVCICTVADTEESFARLMAALESIPARTPLSPMEPQRIPPVGKRLLSLRVAALSPQEAAPLEKAAGRIAAISAGMYPPGIPLVLPGEEVTAACVAKLQSLPPERRFGIENNSLICVK